MSKRDKVETVRKCLRKLANRGFHADRVYPLEGEVMVTDGAALYCTPGKTRTRKRFGGEEEARKLIAKAKAAKRWRKPPTWPRVYRLGFSVQVGKCFYDVRYITLARYLLGDEARYTTVDVGGPRTNNGALPMILIFKSDRGVALIMPLRWAWEDRVKW